jgi:hypothetical protein
MKEAGMAWTSLSIANEATVVLSAEEDGPALAFIREVRASLAEMGRDSRTGSSLRMAAFSLSDFGDLILGDLTGAVPWDETSSLRKARLEAISLLREGYDQMAAADAGDGDWVGFFGAMGDIRARYESLIEDLNTQDRESLSRPLGGN